MECIGGCDQSAALDTELFTQPHFSAFDVGRQTSEHALRRSIVGSQFNRASEVMPDRSLHRRDTRGHARHRARHDRQCRHQASTCRNQTQRIGFGHYTGDCCRRVFTKRMTGHHDWLNAPAAPERSERQLHRDNRRLHVSCIGQQRFSAVAKQHVDQ